jgi:transcriptional regulator with XRE-family HTH domain
VPKKPGKRIRQIRLERKLSQEALADACDLDRSYMSGVERGIRNITVLTLVQIAKALRVPPHRLLDFS